MTEDDSTLAQIIGRYGNRHAVSENNTDSKLAELASEMSLDLRSCLSFHDKGAAGVDVLDDALNFNQIFTGQICLMLCCRRRVIRAASKFKSQVSLMHWKIPDTARMTKKVLQTQNMN